VDALLSGGLARWREFKSLSAHMSIGGPLWAIKGWEEVLTDVTVTIDTRVERTTFEPFTDPNLRVIFEVDTERVTIETTDGEQVRELRDARAGFKGFVRTTPWERTHLGYFLGYAFGTISPHQVFYFDTDGLQRRMDYVTEILDSTLVAHYSSRHRSFGGILIPTRRRVFRRNPDNTSNLNMPSITIDIHDVMLQRGHRSHRSNRDEHRPGSINVHGHSRSGACRCLFRCSMTVRSSVSRSWSCQRISLGSVADLLTALGATVPTELTV
jgi:hypothetical protein